MTTFEETRASKQALDKAIRGAGGARALARELDINHSAILRWRLAPPIRVLKLERLTGVSRHDLRPDIYPREGTCGAAPPIDTGSGCLYMKENAG